MSNGNSARNASFRSLIWLNTAIISLSFSVAFRIRAFSLIKFNPLSETMWGEEWNERGEQQKLSERHKPHVIEVIRLYDDDSPCFSAFNALCAIFENSLRCSCSPPPRPINNLYFAMDHLRGSVTRILFSSIIESLVNARRSMWRDRSSDVLRDSWIGKFLRRFLKRI